MCITVHPITKPISILFPADCKTSYHHNFYIKGGYQHYYTEQPPVIEVSEHQYIEHKVIDLWIDAMVISHTSATNCGHLYHRSFSHYNPPPSNWPIGFTLTTEHIWDAFTIACLLDDCTHLNSQLVIPSTGPQKDRFNKAMQARNLHFHLYGQPELNHRCDKCTRMFHGDEVWVVVVDGVMVGHPCCTVHNCFEPLQNQRDCHCRSHEKTEGRICQIKGCMQVREKDSHVCVDQEHVEAERIHIQHGQAWFQLKERLERAWVAHPNDSIAEEPKADDVVDDEAEQEIEITTALQNNAQNMET
jgi:CxC5 like cysteine cluster associated with KDZ transposases/CxC6 like cysteine cluster associated with KDZ transposases